MIGGWSGSARFVIRCVLDCACACAVAFLLAAASARAQSVNDGFNVTVDGPVVASAVQADGKVLIGGYFETVNGQARAHLARLFVDGSLDPGFANLDNNVGVTSLAVLDNGSIIVGGEFTHFGTCPCAHLVKLHVDGSVDLTWHPDPDGPISAIVRQRDGRLLIAGSFTHVGASTHHYIARINRDGSVDETYPPPGGDPDQAVSAIAMQPDGKALIGGAFDMIGEQAASHVARLRLDGSLDGTFLAANPIDGPVYTLVVRLDGKVVIGGAFQTINYYSRPYLARLKADGSLDAPYPALDDFVYTLTIQPDGKLLAGGNFFLVGGQEANKIARFNVDDTFDTGFRPPYVSTAYITSSVRTFGVQQDGRIVAGGAYTPFDGATRAVGRLNADGTLDADYSAFEAGTVSALAQQSDQRMLVGLSSYPEPHPTNLLHRLNGDGSDDPLADAGILGPANGILVQADQRFFVTSNGYPGLYHSPIRFDTYGAWDQTFFDPVVQPSPILRMVPDADDGIFVFGLFSSVSQAHVPRESVAKLAANGLTYFSYLGPDFDDGSAFVSAMSVHEDGSAAIGGSFMIGGSQRFVAYLDADGTLDPGKDKAFPNGSVRRMALQPDGKTLICGFFTTVTQDGTPYSRSGVARLNADGSLDTSFVDSQAYFSESPANVAILDLALQTDGKVLVAGQFDKIGGKTRQGIARLHADGTLDEAFADVGVNDLAVEAITLQSDGRLVVGGGQSLIGDSRHYLARLSFPDPALQSLTLDSNNLSVRWLRSGAAPELSMPPKLQLSNDGEYFYTFGTMSRIAGGWQIPILNYPGVLYLRAVGFTASGSSVDSLVQTAVSEFIFAAGFE